MMRLPVLLRHCAIRVTAPALLTFLAACGGAGPAPANTPSTDVAALAGDDDGTLDWSEVKSAALAKFDRLDVDHDGTLDPNEAAGAGIDKATFEQADPDHDGTLTKDEYLALVQQAFKAADPDADGAVSAAELRTSAGQRLSALIH